MKLVVFAHTPPPHHGQSFMVAQLLEALRADPRFAVHHVNARFSDDIQEIGRGSGRKVWRALRFAAAAIAGRWRHGARAFYYVPAPPVRAAIYRDWIVLALCRPFFRQVILHWHAVGLGQWLENEARPWERWLTRRLLGRPAMSIVLGEYNRSDADTLGSRRTVVVPNGIPDPCPQFDSAVLARREARAAARQRLSTGKHAPTTAEEARTLTVVFLGLCYRPKGLFDAVEAVALANARLRGAASPLRVRLVVAGRFFKPAEQEEFDRRRAQPDLTDAAGPMVEYRGFLSGDAKAQLLTEADALVFPTYYEAESFGLVAVEAMAFGLPVIASRWRTVPELFPQDYPWLVEPQSPQQIADALLGLLRVGYDPGQRKRFLDHYTISRFAGRMTEALSAVEV
jgi:glycosyltransferase involved in cell wall biosynthesis